MLSQQQNFDDFIVILKQILLIINIKVKSNLCSSSMKALLNKICNSKIHQDFNNKNLDILEKMLNKDEIHEKYILNLSQCKEVFYYFELLLIDVKKQIVIN